MKSSLALSLLFLSLAQASAADWPTWRGPQHNGHSAEKPLTTWPGDGPKVLWKASLGLGFSSFVIAEGKLFTMGHPEEEQDCVYAFDATTGKPLWEHRYEAELGDKYYPGGTTGTPTVDGARVYTLSRWGDLFCFEASSGKIVWQKNIATEVEARIPDWGFTGAPLVLGDQLILNVGAAGTALDKATGKVLWKSGTALAAGYTTPFTYQQGGNTQLVLANENAYLGLDPASGNQLWSLPWGTRYGVNAADPVLCADGQLFIATGYGKGCALIQPGTGELKPLWTNRDLRSQMNAALYLDGHLYGSDGDENTKSAFKCLDAATGKTLWADPSLSFGSAILASGHLLILSQKGELTLAKASPTGLDTLATAQILSGKCWTAPVLANGLLYARNGAGDMVCLDLRTGQ